METDPTSPATPTAVAPATPAIRAGDTIRHKPTSAVHVVAWANAVSVGTSRVPQLVFHVSDCEVTHPADDAQHQSYARHFEAPQ